ncbi:hypothetical protein SynMVIR181_00205 [Synechococcus sp. MVIR-18-1]|nr:hypothetical protein SynMVIR181_00205 [Synechococcus sp. MVIR-18-1]
MLGNPEGLLDVKEAPIQNGKLGINKELEFIRNSSQNLHE